ncbi:MAG: hypothetical protein ACTSR2_01790 [Candidatus Hodarchaeales archaeon]
MVNNDDEKWLKKYLRENWTMPFGSLMNAYAIMHQEKPRKISDFTKDAIALYELSKHLIRRSIEDEEEIEEQSIELKIGPNEIKKIIKSHITDKQRERQIGRYWATDLYPMIKGYLKPEDFFKEKEYDERSVSYILTGEANEDILTKIFTEQKVKFEPQVKKEIKINDEITLVVVADFVFEDKVIETKHPFKEVGWIPERYLYQLEAEYRAFKKPVYLGVIGTPFSLRFLKYTPSDERWKQIKEILIRFHNALWQLNNKEKTNKNTG